MRNKDIQGYSRDVVRRSGATLNPVDLLAIAGWAGIRVVKNSDAHVLSAGESGKLLSDGNSHVIVYRDTDSLELRRFTVAHELGHYFLSHEKERRRLAAKHERQADVFASCLLKY